MNFYQNSNFYQKGSQYQSKVNIYSAGILPYQVNKEGKVYLLLGKDPQENWSDFGGKSEIKDNNDIRETAAREFFEESLNSVIDINTAREMLRNENNYVLATSKTLNGSPYYMFMLRLPMKPEASRDRFKKTLKFIEYMGVDYKWKEKTDIMWVSLDTLLFCLENPINEQELNWPLRKVFKNTMIYNKESLMKLKYK
jgi:hypothetical protein